MLQKLLFLIFLISTGVSAQIVGKVTDSQGEPLSNVNIYLQEGYTGTTSNDQGNYSLALPDDQENEEREIIFRILGYTTLAVRVSPTSFPYVLNTTLQDQTTNLEEVLLNSEEDPAYSIIRKTIAQQKENIERVNEYTADFYSRGILKLKDIPEKILGRRLGNLNGALDSSRAGIVYLSETLSKIAFERPDKFNEKIIASKVSWDDRGFSFNSAESSNFSFYENDIVIKMALVSPIAHNALGYYHYKLEGVFHEGTKLINKIKVIPRRPKDRVFQGYIYIVENDWQLYAVDLSTTGAAIEFPLIDELSIKQNYKFDPEYNFWTKISQTIDYSLSLFGMKGDGRFIGIYSNYNFQPKFQENTFGNDVISFAPQANEKNSLFWKNNRPVPLTQAESRDYIRRDSLQDLLQTKPYLDSLDANRNKPTLLSPIIGYSYKNSYQKWKLRYDSFVPMINFNTVQGWNARAAVGFKKWYDFNRTNTLSARLVGEYGLSDKRFRVFGNITRVFNMVDKLEIGLSGGSKVSQFNLSFPITPLMNTLSTLLLEKNGMKVYELNFAQIDYSQEIFNGLDLYGSFGFENRKPLFNTTDFVIIRNREIPYTSNNPLAPNDFTTGVIEDHDMLKSKLRAKINFAQKYFSHPDRKLNINDQVYPEVNLILINGISPTASHYDFTHFEARLNQSFLFGNKGRFSYLFTGGGFANGDGISFVDYKHFNGDETAIGTTETYIDVFNLMSFFGYSTNKVYFEGHLEHNFHGWILGKIPGINQLNLNLVLGAHYLSTVERKPYTEFSVGLDNLGIGKFRMLRLDLINSYYEGNSKTEIVLGLKFFDLLKRGL